MELHVYDIFMLVIIVVATLTGAWKGMAWQVVTLGAVAGGYALAHRFADRLGPHLPGEGHWNHLLSMLLIFVGALAVIRLACGLLSHLIERVKLQEFDHHVGAVFGVLKGGVFGTVVTFFSVGLSDRARDVILQTRSGYCAAQVLQHLQPILPRGWNDRMQPHFVRLAATSDSAEPWKTPVPNWSPKSEPLAGAQATQPLPSTVPAPQAYPGSSSPFPPSARSASHEPSVPSFRR